MYIFINNFQNFRLIVLRQLLDIIDNNGAPKMRKIIFLVFVFYTIHNNTYIWLFPQLNIETEKWKEKFISCGH
jgi:hypothetical protein